MSEAAAGRGTETELEPEDRARANLYGVISRLFSAPADSNLLAEICRDGQGGSGEGGDLTAAVRAAFAEAVKASLERFR